MSVNQNIGVYNITLAGVISDEAFHKCSACIAALKAKFGPNIKSNELTFFPTQWDQYLKKIQNEKKGPFYQHKKSPLVFFDSMALGQFSVSTYIGGEAQFLEWALQEFRYVDTNKYHYKKIAADMHRTAINDTPGRDYVYMNINTGASVPSKVVIELFSDICPKTCENFKQLCEGYSKSNDKAAEKMGYVGTEFHRVVQGMYIQGGDLSKVYSENKTGFSIYDGEFADESYNVKHEEQGLLGMCKRSGVPHTNECQFYVTTGAPLTFLDGQTVIFGRVIEGFRVFKLIEKMDCINEKPQPSVTIGAAGVYKMDKLTKKIA